MEVRHGRSVSTFGSLPSFLAFFVFFCPFFPFFAENTPNQIRWGILRYSRWRERHSFVPGENTKKGEKLAHIVPQWRKKMYEVAYNFFNPLTFPSVFTKYLSFFLDG